MDARSDGEFARFVADRTLALLRTAHALTGDRYAAEDLVQGALAKAMLEMKVFFIKFLLLIKVITHARKRIATPEFP